MCIYIYSDGFQTHSFLNDAKLHFSSGMLKIIHRYGKINTNRRENNDTEILKPKIAVTNYCTS